MAASAEIARANGAKGGRPKGSLNSRAKLSEYKTRQLMADDESPLDVMIDNMLHWRRQALKYGVLLDEKHELLMRFKAVEINEETLKQFMTLLREHTAVANKMLEARERSQKCAVDAAPYVHPKLSSIAVKSPNGNKGLVKFSLGIGQLQQVVEVTVDGNGNGSTAVIPADADEG